MKIETERLILRKPAMKDIKDLIENINNLNVSRCLLVVPYPYTVKDARWWINNCKEKPKDDPNFNIELKSEKKLIGGIGLANINNHQKTATLGYWLGEKYWRKGIVTEAIIPLLDFAFNKLKLRRLDILVFIGNEPSTNLAKKIGAKHEGTRKKAAICKATGKIHDEKIYGLLKEDWKKARKKLIKKLKNKK